MSIKGTLSKKTRFKVWYTAFQIDNCIRGLFFDSAKNKEKKGSQNWLQKNKKGYKIGFENKFGSQYVYGINKSLNVDTEINLGLKNN